MDKETWDRMMDDNKQPKWKETSVKQVRLILGRDLNRLQSDMNQELLALTLEHNQIENIRTYPFVESNMVRYIGEITYTTSYLIKVPKEDTSEKNNK